MSATTTSAKETPANPGMSAHIAGGSKPPAWALVDFRDDEPDGHVPAPTAPTPATRTPPSKRPSMSMPQDFIFSKELGSGSWSTVLEAVHTGTSERYAVKILSKAQLIKQKKVKYASVEKDSLVKLSGTHPGIVRMWAAFQDETSLYFVLDLAPHGDLADLVKKHGSLNLRCARWYTAQIVDAIFWIHSTGIVHRDVKPENMLLDNEFRIKLTDFGSAYIAPDGDLSPRSSTFVGSAAYVSPELLNRASKTTSSSSDIWAIGCTLFFIIAGTPPFVAINDYQSFRKIEALDYTFPDGFYESAKDLVQKLLVLDPSDRLGVEPKSSPTQLRGHAFFSTVSAASLEKYRDVASIRWDTLWTDPPLPPETGIIQPAPSPDHDDENADLWDDVVHEFSLVDIRSPNGAPTSTPGIPPPGPPVDVAPDVVPYEVVESVHSDQEPPCRAIVVSPDAPTPAATTAEDDDVDHTALRAKDWSLVVAPGESVRRMASVKTSIRKGFVKQPRSCALLLTSRPRIVCVPLDDKQRTPKSSDVKHSLELRRREGNMPIAKSPKSDKQEVVQTCRVEHNQSRLIIRTGEKEYVYEFADDRALAWWTQEINSLLNAT
ncbi:kinase-like domain-containing protein [Fomes fomentarius]|nr:kinase-like domain-containing protein [Fomes fomentarius]